MGADVVGDSVGADVGGDVGADIVGAGVEQSSPSYPAPLSKQLFWQYLLVVKPESAGFSAEEDQNL